MRAHLRHFGLITQRNFVDSVDAMYYKGVLCPEFRQHVSQFLHKRSRWNSDHLRCGAGGIRERPQQVEDGPAASLAPSRCGMTHSGVHAWSKKESDANLLNGSERTLRGDINLHSKRLENVGGAAARTE